MSILNTSKIPVGKSPIESNDINLPLQEIENVVNGNIDSTNLADNGVTAAKIPDAGITNIKAGFDWQDYTPTTNNLTATLNYGRYAQTGKIVHFRIKYTLFSAGVGAGPTISLPVPAAANYTAGQDTVDSTVLLRDAGTAVYTGALRYEGGDTVSIRAVNTAGAFATIHGSSLSATVPHNWVATDTITINGTYEAA